MALDRNYFNNIELEPLRRKFYDIEAVDALLVDIRSKAEMMNREAEALREKAANAEAVISSLRAENEELFKKGEELSREVTALRGDLEEARAKSAETSEKYEKSTLAPEWAEEREAKEKAENSARILQEAKACRARAMQALENLFDRTREMQADMMDQLDDQWEAFLSGVRNEEQAPEDLGAKVENIARELREIEEGGNGT